MPKSQLRSLDEVVRTHYWYEPYIIMIMQSSIGEFLVMTIYDERTEETTVDGPDAKEFC